VTGFIVEQSNAIPWKFRGNFMGGLPAVANAEPHAETKLSHRDLQIGIGTETEKKVRMGYFGGNTVSSRKSLALLEIFSTVQQSSDTPLNYW
jgi:hypothetical protein